MTNLFGVTSITFFGPDGSTQEFLDHDGRFRYERNRSGAEFTFSVELTRDRSFQIRVAVFNHQRSLDDMELDAHTQLKRILLRLGQIGEEIEGRVEIGHAPQTEIAA